MNQKTLEAQAPSRERFRQDMIAFLQAEDRNGCFSDEDSINEGGRPMTLLDGLEIVTRWAFLEVENDISNGDVPPTVGSFSELHNYVDANKYGGAFSWPMLIGDTDDEVYVELHFWFWNVVQGAVDQWLKNGDRNKPQEFCEQLNAFRKSGRDTDDIGDEVNDEGYLGIPGRMYGRLFIEICADNFDKNQVIIGNQLHVGSLEECENVLFGWAYSEGYRF